MFDIFFGWRKASKCKKLIKRVRCRLKLLKNKRHAIVKQLRQDLAQLIKLGYEEGAFNRADQLFRDESAMAIYEMLDTFCEFVILNLSYIRRHKDIPNDINEAVSSLIFASARCGDLPELSVIRKLFGERYGLRFATAAVELLPGNLVNHEVKEKLSIKEVSDEVKHRLVDEIAEDYCLRPKVLALEYTSELKQQEQENSGDQMPDRNVPNSCGTNEGTNIQVSDTNDMEENSMFVDPHLTSNIFMTTPGRPHSSSSSEAVAISVRPSMVQQSSPETVDSPVHNVARKEENPIVGCGGNRESHERVGIDANKLKDGEERKKAASSSESLPHFPEETVVYLDDIEEFQYSTKDGGCQDQRLFRFKTFKFPNTEVSVGSSGESSGSLCQQKVRKLRRSEDSSMKRSRRRSLSVENSTKYTDYEIYYRKPSHKHRSHSPRRVQGKTTEEEREQSTNIQKIFKQPCSVALGTNRRQNGCRVHEMISCCNFCWNREMETRYMEHPCFFCTSNEEDEQKVIKWKKNGRPTSLEPFPVCHLKQSSGNKLFHCHCSLCGGSMGHTNVKETKLAQNVRRSSCEHGANEYNIFTWLDNKQRENMEVKVEGSNSPSCSASSNSSSPTENSSQARNENLLPAYSRAMTMPQERANVNLRESIMRSNSCSFQHSKHVHPKLPDYDDIAAKFSALKKQYLQNKKQFGDQ